MTTERDKLAALIRERRDRLGGFSDSHDSAAWLMDRGVQVPEDRAPAPDGCPRCNSAPLMPMDNGDFMCRSVTCGWIWPGSPQGHPSPPEPDEPRLVREGNHVRYVGFGGAPLSPDFIPSHLSKGGSPEAPSPEAMGEREIIGWVEDALDQLEYESDATGYLERLIEALKVRGVRATAETKEKK